MSQKGGPKWGILHCVLWELELVTCTLSTVISQKCALKRWQRADQLQWVSAEESTYVGV